MDDAKRRWPSKRSDRATIASRFGDERADQVQHALLTGDPLADAVSEEMHENGAAVARQLMQGLEHGLASIPRPTAAVEALLRSTETIPDDVDPAIIEAGQRSYYTSPEVVHALSLAAGALGGGFSAGNLSDLMSVTGRLEHNTMQRLTEDGKWLATAMLPGSLRLGAKGYVATVQVRLHHARVRQRARHQGFDEAAFGVPLGQADMARGWMAFTVTTFRAEEEVGYGLTAEEQGVAYRYWRYVGHLLGIESTFIAGVESNDVAAPIDDLLSAVNTAPTATSIALTRACIEANAEVIHDIIHLPTIEGRHILECLIRRFHGDELADSLHVPPRPETNVLVAGIVKATARHRAHLRTKPDEWGKLIEHNIAEAIESLGTVYAVDPEYETAITESAAGRP